jgi:hypothetical protein
MPLLFHQVYQFEDVTRTFLNVPLIAVGTRISKRAHPTSGKISPVVDFIHSEWTHQVFGTPKDTALGTTRIEDTYLKESGISPVWQFTPLTLAAWRRLGEAGIIIGYGQLRTVIYDDASLKNFYLNEWLFDTWEPNPKD